MHAIKRALLAGTILPILAVGPGFGEALRSEGPVLLAQMQPQGQGQGQDPRQRRPGGLPPPQQGRPAVQQPRPP
ncbi:MAG: hypothetical protein ACT6XS_18675, partial [Phreatobacter sp.]